MCVCVCVCVVCGSVQGVCMHKCCLILSLHLEGSLDLNASKKRQVKSVYSTHGVFAYTRVATTAGHIPNTKETN